MIDTEANERRVTFLTNGNVGVYLPCPVCKGTGAQETSWGDHLWCNACSCTGWRLDHVIETAERMMHLLDHETNVDMPWRSTRVASCGLVEHRGERFDFSIDPQYVTCPICSERTA